MKQYQIEKPATLIKDLPFIKGLRPEFVEALETSLHEWVEHLIPFYEEFKRSGADVFKCYHTSSFGNSPDEGYVRDGVFYRFSQSPLWGKALSLDGEAVHDGKCGYDELNWRGRFWNRYPEFHGSKPENTKDNMAFSWYMHRYHKKDSKYNILQDRLRDYFRYLTQDPDIFFDAGWNSFIYYDSRIRDTLERNPSTYY